MFRIPGDFTQPIPAVYLCLSSQITPKHRSHSCLRLPVSSVFTSLALYFIQGAFSGSALNLMGPPDCSFPYPPKVSSVFVFLPLCFLSQASQWQDRNNCDVACWLCAWAGMLFIYVLTAGHSHLLLLTSCLSVFSCHQMSPCWFPTYPLSFQTCNGPQSMLSK